MGLRLELKDGDRTLAVHTKKDVVNRMLDAAQGTAQQDAAAPAPRRKAKAKRKALGRGAEPVSPVGE